MVLVIFQKYHQFADVAECYPLPDPALVHSTGIHGLLDFSYQTWAINFNFCFIHGEINAEVFSKTVMDDGLFLAMFCCKSTWLSIWLSIWNSQENKKQVLS